MIYILFILLGCFKKANKPIGVVDVVESNTCVIQLDGETTVTLTSKICTALKEGDILQVKRLNENR